MNVPNPNRMCPVTEHPRIEKMYNVWAKLQRVTHNSWPALFGTKEHKRRVARRDRMATRFIAEVRRTLGIWAYDVQDLGRYNTRLVITWRED
jgi:hypothetical protein